MTMSAADSPQAAYCFLGIKLVTLAEGEISRQSGAKRMSELHVVDRHRLVRRYHVSDAAEHDSQVLDLDQGHDERPVPQGPGPKLAAVSPGAYAMASPVAASPMRLWLRSVAEITQLERGRPRKSGSMAGATTWLNNILRQAPILRGALGYDAAGEVMHGELAIVPGQATVIRRIYDDYVGGRSPRAIAIALNKEDVIGPSGKGWTASTIIGNRKRGTGILNNQLYVGRRIWNRLTYRRDPATRKRISQPNPPDDWIINEVPELRIIEDDLWAIAQALREQRSRETRADIKRDPDWRLRRPKHLFSGLIKCAACGGGMTLISRVYYGCATNRNKGTCDNRLTLRLDRLEEAVLGGLQERLLTPELTKSFVQEYTREFNRLQAEASAKRVAKGQRLAVVDRQIVNIVETIAAGEASPALLQRLGELEREKADLEANRTETEPDPIRLHPNVDQYYVHKVAELRAALNQDASRHEAAEILRTLVDEIRLHPIDGELQIELIGDLATLLGFAKEYDPDKKSPGRLGDPGRTKWLVAGARSHLYRTKFRWIPRSRSRAPTKLSV